MPSYVVFTGLACGLLLTGMGATLKDGFRPVPGLARAVQLIGWLAGVTLLVGALSLWLENPGLPTAGLRLTLMAALVAPLTLQRRCHSHWRNAMHVLLALILTMAGLFWALGLIGAEATGSTVRPTALTASQVALAAPPIILAVIFCAGLGTRALGEALSAIIAPPVLPADRTPDAVYALLTLLVGGITLVNLWQRGIASSPNVGEGGLAGTWLAWGAAHLGPRTRPRLRAALVVVAALLLLWIGLTFA